MVGAAGVVLVHNHPSGTPEPSADDVAITRRLQQALDLLERHLERLGPVRPQPAPIISSAIVTSAAILSELRSVAHIKAHAARLDVGRGSSGYPRGPGAATLFM